MRARWLEERRESLWRRAWLSPLVPPSWLVGGAARLRRRLYTNGPLPQRRFAGHVISVGNLVVGGTGKTPAAAWIAERLHARGRRVVLASRGYGGHPRDPVVVVSDGRYLRSFVETAGDEALILASHAPGVPVLIGRDRGLLGMRALSAFGAELLVLDDGFQHLGLHRDIDVVSVDGALGFGNRRILPRGPLREPLSALRAADAVAVVDGPLDPADAELLERWTPSAFRLIARRRPRGLRPLAGGPPGDPRQLDGVKVGLLAGIASPASLRHTLESLGAQRVAERVFPDHHRYRPRDLAGLAAETPVWVTTEKDAVKILPAWTRGADVRVLSIDLEVDDATRFLDWIEGSLV